EGAQVVVGGADDFRPGMQDRPGIVILQAGQFGFDLLPPLRQDFQVLAYDMHIQRQHDPPPEDVSSDPILLSFATGLVNGGRKPGIRESSYNSGSRGVGQGGGPV